MSSQVQSNSLIQVQKFRITVHGADRFTQRKQQISFLRESKMQHTTDDITILTCCSVATPVSTLPKHERISFPGCHTRFHSMLGDNQPKSARALCYSYTTVYCGIRESSVFHIVDSGLTNLIHDRCSCTLFTLSSVSSIACSRLAGCVHSSVNKPGANWIVSYDSLTHYRFYCRYKEKK